MRPIQVPPLQFRTDLDEVGGGGNVASLTWRTTMTTIICYGIAILAFGTFLNEARRRYRLAMSV